MLSQAINLLLTEVFWNLIVWVPTIAFSLLFIRLFLGVRMAELLDEVEHHQTAAVGFIFFAVSLGSSMLISRAIGDPQTVNDSWIAVAFWLGLGFVIAMTIFMIGVAV